MTTYNPQLKFSADSIVSVPLFGIRIHDVTMEETLVWLARCLAGTEHHFLVTPNVDHIVRLHKDPEFRQVYQQASLVVTDGMPVLWGSWIVGKPLRARVPGSDLMLPACSVAANHGHSVFILGGMPGVPDKAADNLQRLIPELKIAGFYSPPFGFEKDANENRKIIDMINASGAKLLFVALGAPKQEKWIAAHINSLNSVKVSLCVGAAVDFIAGNLERAPRWVQEMALEWVWRIFHDPKRLLKRYLVDDMAFIPIFIKEFFSSRIFKTSPRR